MATNRGADGRFLPGKSGNPGGRPVKTDWLRALEAAVTPEKWGRIIDKAVADAIAGDRWARQWIGNYLMGSPKQHVQVEDVTPLDDALLERIEKIYAGRDE